LFANEKQGGSDKRISGMLAFRNVIDDCGLIDLGFSGPVFTWSNKRKGTGHVQERLDRFIATHSWVNLFGNFKVKHRGFMFSDHRHILLSRVDRNYSFVTQNSGNFKFESC